MQYAACMFATDYAIRPDELARAMEERGFESVWLPEHSHFPTDKMGPTGVELPMQYWHSYDPFVALGTMASVTKRLKLATGVCLVIQRDAIQLAKEVASLDHLSDGRFLFGVGGGWNKQEMEDHGTHHGSRWRRLKDSLQAMKALWTEDEASHEGEFVRFKPSLAFPKPVQKPHPPIHLGGHGEHALKRVVDYCDGWMPIYRMVDEIPKAIADLRQRLTEAGRDPRSVEVSIFMAPPKPEVVEQMRVAGVDRVIFGLPSEDRDKVMPLLDEIAGKFLGAKV